ncbi:DUF748 domain-containing protein [Fulvivirga sediminis]|uniref:DUF748 domain-containing protein n=1 Tax=Fulvivirga sediminis TaxID=2803949 RepID=A0A937FBS6_9BACT|nr:DUF748 domain-containing protein [Fulvivirga sediminis]MBL3657573.1 DUF748 domain-containing protein [Fulvivirga sediminis]
MKKSLKVLLVVLVLLIGGRIYLPFWITDYVNKVLDEVTGYSGSIEGVTLSLYRGAYQIEGLKMVKTGEDIPVPFLDIENIDLSIQWGALFKGKVVGEVELLKPKINFVVSLADSTQAEQTGEGTDWTEPIKDLMPLQINHFAVNNGVIAYRDFSSDPKVDISIDSLQLQATNLGNAERKKGTLPSDISATATSVGGGVLSLKAKANLLKEIPDFDMNAKFEGVDMPALNDFAQAYAKLDFEKGTFNLYSEMAVADGQLEGYVKPIMNDLQIVNFSEDKKKPLKLIWEGFAELVKEIFENHPHDQFATKVPMKGDLNNPKTKIWPTIGNIFKNAFIQAIQKKTDDSVSFEDVVGEK